MSSLCLVLNGSERQAGEIERVLARTGTKVTRELTERDDAALILRVGLSSIQLAHWNAARRAVCPSCLDRRCKRMEDARKPHDSRWGLSNGLPVLEFAADAIEGLSQILHRDEQTSGFELDLTGLNWRR